MTFTPSFEHLFWVLPRMLRDLGGASTLKVKGSFSKKLRYCRMSCPRRVLPEARLLTEGLDTIRHTVSSRSPSGTSLLVRVSPSLKLFAGDLEPRFCTTEAFDINRDVGVPPGG